MRVAIHHGRFGEPFKGRDKDRPPGCDRRFRYLARQRTAAGDNA
jgi:hypothetical protein